MSFVLTMTKFFKKPRIVGKRGFTLIELLVVIAIIGVLASVVLASLNTARRKSRDARRITDLKQVQLALELYFDANGEYPFSGTTPVFATDLAVLRPTYIPALSADPSPGRLYQYRGLIDSTGTACTSSGSTCLYYHMGADLEENNQNAGQPLAGDADMCPDTATGCVRVSITGALNGEDADGCINTAGQFCFDVTP